MAVSHRTNRLKLVGTPAVEQLQNGRYQLTVNCTTMNSREDWYSSNKARIFPDFGSLESAEMSIDGLSPRTGEAYTDMRLVAVQSSTQGGQYIVTLVYQTLGDSFVQVKDDTVNYTENGLRRVIRESIAKAGTDFQKTVGTTSITSQIDNETAVQCFLSSYEIDDTDSYREVTEVYVEPGEIQTSTRPGRIDGTTEVTIVSTGTAVVPSGTPISSSQTEKQGYSTFTNTCIQVESPATITGVKQTYKDVVQVEVPGEVKCTEISVSSGGITGDIAVPEVTPRRRKTIASTVTVEVTNTPPNTASVAFDLGAISCSVTSTNVSLSRGPGPTVTVGTNAVVSQTGFTQNFGASARIQTYPGCFLTDSSSTGTISYVSSSTPRAAGAGIVSDVFNSDRQTKCIGTGSTSATGYTTTGIIKRNSRPIVTALDGTTFYEVITWSV
jgi:hypothetical protein